MGRKRKLTPEQRARFAELDRRAEEHLRRAWAHIEWSIADLETKRAAARRGEIELPPSWAGPPAREA